MSVTTSNAEEESFIILGTSPGASLLQPGAPPPVFDSGPEALKDVMKEFSNEGSLAFKAHFNLNDSPSPSSMLLAGSMVSEASGEAELQRRFGELLDENVVLRETLRTNNSSLKDKLLLIASCQEDMLRTHKLHKDKFHETRELIEKLRAENRKLKVEIKKSQDGAKCTPPTSPAVASPPTSLAVASLAGASDVAEGTPRVNGESSLAYEFVASPDEDTLHKLTSQLELVERQRRQVIAENEKLTWQKESLEHMVDVTSKERDHLREQLRTAQLQCSTRESTLVSETHSLKTTIKDLQNKLQQSENLDTMGALERDNTIHMLETKLSSLQAELKSAQLKLLEMENLKLEVSRARHGGAETARVYREQLHELQARLKEAQTTVFQPIRFSISSEKELESSEHSQFVADVKLYDKSLKHLSELLNMLTSGASESLERTMQLAIQASELKVEQCSPEQLKASIVQIKSRLEEQHSAALQTTGQVRATISIFEKIFQDYTEVLRELAASRSNETRNANLDAVTAALVSREQELQRSTEELAQLRALVPTLQRESDERDHLRAQMDVYKADFEAERESREKLASDKDSILSDMRGLQRRNQALTEQLEEVRKMNPNIFLSATSKRPYTTPRTTPGATSTTNTPTTGTGNMARAKKKKPDEASGDGSLAPARLRCPVCDKDFRSLKLLQEHVDQCLL